MMNKNVLAEHLQVSANVNEHINVRKCDRFLCAARTSSSKSSREITCFVLQSTVHFASGLSLG